MVSPAYCLFFFILTFVTIATIHGQPFNKADSGWVPVFNGTDFEGLYSRLYNKDVSNTVDPMFKVKYAGTDSAEIYVPAVGGEIGTQRTDYIHYRMRIQYRFDEPGTLNAGFLYHMDETYPRMGGGKWPRSIECQMKEGQGGDAYSIQQVAFNTRVSGLDWDPEGKDVTVCESGCNRRAYGASPEVDLPGPAWNDMEVVVRGSDSALHIVNDQIVFKLWDIRIADKGGKTLQKWDRGSVGVEAENAIVHYRRWEIMELPDTGPNFLQKLLLQKPEQGEVLKPGTEYTISWKSIGEISTVKLQYQTSAGSWKVIADEAPNSGSYNWKVPSESSTELRIKISSAFAWVMADSSGTNSISNSTALSDGWQIHPIPIMDQIKAKERDIIGRNIPNASRGKFLRVLP